ncbi:hypothetical protein JCM3766R1_003699 [Sporobolomyces carnicolor]
MSNDVDADAPSDALSALSLTDPPRAHDTLDSASETLSATLETLPNELISAICSHLGSFVLPALSKRLLPFHRSQLYRDVTLDTKGYERFQRSIDSNETLLPFVEHLALNFRLEGSHRSPSPPIPRPATLTKLVSSFPNLKSYDIRLPERCVVWYYPKPSIFTDNPMLERFVVKSHPENTREEMKPIPVDNQLYEEQSDPTVAVDVRKESKEAFCLHYHAVGTAEINIHSVLRCFPLSKIYIVATTHVVHVKRLLDNIGNPLLVKFLDLDSFDCAKTEALVPCDYLSRLSNLAHLSLGGTALPKSPEIYDTLGSLPLVTLRFGPEAQVRVQEMIDRLTNASNPKFATLKILVLDNIEAEAPPREEEDEAEPDEWVFPVWTEECSKAKVRELRDVARTLAIKTQGSTFRGLGIVRSAAYRAAVRRKESEESEESSDDELHFHILRTVHIIAGLDSLHESICGCWRVWTDCWNLADHMGWPRPEQRRRRRRGRHV